jgi:DNA-binding FadR family transcriptional regulator
MKVQRRKTSDILVDRIREYIATNALKPGDQLPTESALAEQYGVSRISVREATKTLGFLGAVEAKAGRGLTVGRVDVGRLKESLSFHPAMYDVPGDELIDTRVVIETGVVPYVARRMAADPGVYERLNRFNDQLRQKHSPSHYVTLDAGFHQLLVESSGLTPLAAFSELLQVFFERFCQSVKDNRQGAAKTHQEIIDGIRDGRIAEVVELLRRHVEDHR